jgi:hypothetical protein
MVDKLFHFFLVRYGKLWADRYANLGLTMNEIKTEWDAEIRKLTPQELQSGIDACRTKTFPPTLPEFIKMCWAGHPTADEAWALALKAMDENQTVVWTNEIMYAWERCRAVYQDGDKVGARMAFKAVYDGLNLSGRPDWIVSEGFDKDKRVVEMQTAQAAGLLGMNDQPKLLGAEASSSSAKAAAIEKLKALKISVKSPVNHEPAVNKEIVKTEDLKRESLEKVREYMEAK